jgi:hypothetical protein
MSDRAEVAMSAQRTDQVQLSPVRPVAPTPALGVGFANRPAAAGAHNQFLRLRHPLKLREELRFTECPERR